MGVQIRLATSEDYSECVRLLAVLGESTGGDQSAFINREVFSKMLDGERGAILIAEEDGKALGMSSISFNIALRYKESYCQLEELVVDPAARGKNVGGLLVEAAVQKARQKGCNDFGLYLMKTTEHNQPFYEKYGFIKVGSEMRQTLNQP